ncbi:nuclear receptor 2C2-associated protein, partial [Antrostomus carolinensis]|uniref:nuclear receptor 2C2-associated protein n=1 Tax=Antrostomus carolinensis TaxID=279965 RepID=UPI0010A98948
TQVPSLTLSPSCPWDGGTCPCRVSSVLNRDVKQFGKKHMFDASEETCWNSDQGEEPVKISDLYPEDINAMQRFQVEETVLDKLKITFEKSTDFFGRIVVYHLGVLGERL